MSTSLGGRTAVCFPHEPTTKPGELSLDCRNTHAEGIGAGGVHPLRAQRLQTGWLEVPRQAGSNDSRKTALRAHAQGRIDDPPTSPPPAPGSSTATATATYQSPPS